MSEEATADSPVMQLLMNETVVRNTPPPSMPPHLHPKTPATHPEAEEEEEEGEGWRRRRRC